MSILKQPDPAKLIISCFMNDKLHFEKLFSFLNKRFGKPDYISKWIDFDYTSYYFEEMGSPLHRKIVAFESLIDQDMLADIKIKTNEIESFFAKQDKRSVNIDPGYLVLSRFVIATGKEYSHRIYIGKKIYADLTLMFSKKKGFTTLDWTYPDYSSENMISILSQIRNKYVLDLKKESL